MPPIPVYLKTDPAMPRPEDELYFLLTQNGAFLCRNHPFFLSDVPTTRPIRALAPHEPGVILRYPKLPAEAMETIVGFFWRVYEMHRSEAIVLLVWDMNEKRYHLLVPEQEATVWTSGSRRSPQDVNYKVPVLPAGQLLVGDIHSHGNMLAFTSITDAADEVHRDGIHGVVGRIEEEPPELHVELAIDGERFRVPDEQIIEGYERRRLDFPAEWLERVHIRQLGWRDWYYDKPAKKQRWPEA